MFASESVPATITVTQEVPNPAFGLLGRAQSDIIDGMFNVGHTRRSSVSVADAINESVATAEKRLADNGYKFKYTGRESGKRYFGVAD